MAEDQVRSGLTTVADRHRVPDIWESGIRGNEPSPKERAALKEKADKDNAAKAKLAKKKAAAGEGGEEEAGEQAAAKPKKKGHVLVPHSWYKRAKAAMESGKKK